MSTRNRTDSYTAYRTLCEDRAPDGGLYVPFRLPLLAQDDIASLRDQSAGQIVAQILNLFFSLKLTGWDVDMCVGKAPFRIKQPGHRLFMGELWHNPEMDYEHFACALYRRMVGDTAAQPTEWAQIAIRISVLFALFGQLLSGGITHADIAVSADDFLLPMAAWYARKMGLPVGNIICCCQENNAAWDFICNGQLLTSGAGATRMERLVYETLGADEMNRYLIAAEKGSSYCLDPLQLDILHQGLFVSVVSCSRLSSVIKSTFRMCGYILDRKAAISYGGLQDHRASSQENRETLLLSDSSPLLEVEYFSQNLGITADQIQQTVNLSKE